MIYQDPIYGPTTITEPVLLDLMQSAALQRLRGVLQHGITGLIGLTDAITRFDHSAGAMLLVRRLGAPLPEQIAALLHDVSHTAFSHVIDHVFGSALDQSYHDQVKETYLAGSDIPAILDRHGFAWRDFLDESAYPLLEQPSPALCADRLDYFLRDSVGLNVAKLTDISAALDSLAVHNDRIVCTDRVAAGWLGRAFMAADDASWSNFREVGLYELTAAALRRGFAVGAIGEADIWGEDEALWSTLKQSDDAEIQRLVALIRPETTFVWDADRPDFTVTTKIRTIDPALLVDGAAQPLSALDPEFAAARQAYLERKKGAWPMRVVPHP